MCEHTSATSWPKGFALCSCSSCKVRLKGKGSRGTSSKGKGLHFWIYRRWHGFIVISR
jgi:hypothetical protein